MPCRQHGLLSLNITNKSTDDDLLATLAQLTAAGLTTPVGHVQQQQHQNHHQQQQQPQEQVTPAARQGQGGSMSGPSTDSAPLDVCLHYSLKYNYDKTPERSLSKLLRFCQALHKQQQQQQPGAAVDVHVLLVSGGGKKKRFDTVAALQALQQQQQQHGSDKVCLPALAVAFNPYLPVASEAAEERRRLRAKLATGLIDKVYLQV